MNILITKQIGGGAQWVELVITTLTSEPDCCRFVVSSWWGVWEACSAVGVSVPKILSLDIRVCAVPTARGEYISSLCVSAVGGL